MIRTNKILSIAAASALMFVAAPSSLWAESAAPSDDAANFLNGVNCPLNNSPCFDPNASGTKYFGTLTVTYDKDGTCGAGGAPSIRNVFVSVTMNQGNSSVVATTDYLNGVRPHGSGFCFGLEEQEQAYTVIDLITQRILPNLACTAACGFKVKSIGNFQYTGGPLSDVYSGGFRADIAIAVR